MSNLDNIKETAKATEDFAHKIWLAGLGAYGKGFDEAKGKFEELNSDASKLFNELVAKGETLEAEAKSKIKETQTELTDKADERIAQVRETLGLEGESSEDKIAELSAKIDALTDIVEKLSKA